RSDAGSERQDPDEDGGGREARRRGRSARGDEDAERYRHHRRGQGAEHLRQGRRGRRSEPAAARDRMISKPKLFKKILVANRGEIAIRVMRACREMGIPTAAVYSDADRGAIHVRYADEAHHIGGASPTESYLQVDRIVKTAHDCGAEAIHPGYGFLSEKPAFPDACTAAGIEFIGPPAAAMRALGSKLAARQLAAENGVPVTEGSGAVTDATSAIAAAKKLGFPIMVKPSGGGGGIGMKVVESEDDLVAAVESSHQAARSAFGDPTVYLERYMRKPRHVEIQVICDQQGNAVHLGERECSIQRRHQKIMEETPSPALTPELRAAMGAAAIRAVTAAGYVNAGTVEFMFSEGQFFFLEVNARLQVEHPITEAVTGVDLVKEQIRVASGIELGFKQSDVTWTGHAIEMRINAEDATRKFLRNPRRTNP